MQPGPPETIESLAFEGVLAGGAVWLVAAAVAVLSALLLWRERRVLSRGWRIAFWLLRITAVAIVLWMLAGPTHLSTERRTSPQSIALVVDATASMDSADPAQPVSDLRWSLAARSEDSAVAACDRVQVSLSAAAAAADGLLAAAREHQPRVVLRDRVAALQRAVERSAGLLDKGDRGLRALDPRLNDRRERLATLVHGVVNEALDRVRQEVRAEGDPQRLIESAGELADLLRGARRRSLLLAGDAAWRQANREAPTGVGAPGATRRERVDALVASLESGLLPGLTGKCAVRRLRFNRTVETLPEGGWSLSNAGDEGRAPGITPVVYDPSGPVDQGARVGGGDSDDDPLLAAGATDLSAALEALGRLREEGPLRMAILITDGRHNAPGAPAPQDVAARLAGTPVHVVPVGVTNPARDVLIHRVEAPAAVVLDDTAAIEVLLTAFDCVGEQLAVTLRSDGEELQRKVTSVDRARVDQRVVFRVNAEELGWRQFEIEVEPIEDEASLTNNLSTAAIEVVRDKIRVLLADRAPRYEYRYLQQLFRRDDHVEFDEFLTLPELRATGGLSASANLPQTPEEWSRYDVVILGDVGREHLTPDRQQALAEYVRRGGGNLILIAGDRNMPQSFRSDPLAELTPVESGEPIDPRAGFSVRLPAAARLASPVQIRDRFSESREAWEDAYRLAPIYQLSRFNRPKPNTETLLEVEPLSDIRRGGVRSGRGEPRAFFCWSSIGSGRVAYLAAPQSYLLRFRRGDRDHHRFWGQTLRWITAAHVGAGNDRVRIESDRNQYERGQPVEVTVWLTDPEGRPVGDAEFAVEAIARGESVAATEMRPDGGVPGRYVGRFGRLPIGAFEITPVGGVVDQLLADQGPDAEPGVHTLITVQAGGGIEMVNTQSNRPLLVQIAELTGGQVLPPTAISEVFETASFDPEVTETTRRTPLWNRWSNLLIILGCLFAEWTVRKQKGLS